MEQSGEEGDVYAMIAYIKSEDKKGKGKEEKEGKMAVFLRKIFK